jgi:hypothetical protein
MWLNSTHALPMTRPTMTNSGGARRDVQRARRAHVLGSPRCEGIGRSRGREVKGVSVPRRAGNRQCPVVVVLIDPSIPRIQPGSITKTRGAPPPRQRHRYFLFRRIKSNHISPRVRAGMGNWKLLFAPMGAWFLVVGRQHRGSGRLRCHLERRPLAQRPDHYGVVTIAPTEKEQRLTCSRCADDHCCRSSTPGQGSFLRLSYLLRARRGSVSKVSISKG